MKTNLQLAALLTVLTLAAAANAGTFSSLPFTGDADSTISIRDAGLAIDVRGTNNTTVNGSVFTGSANNGTTNPSTNNYTTTGLPNQVDPGPNTANSVTGNVGTMLNAFNYGDGVNAETLTLNNLRVGEHYVTTFFNRSFFQPVDRTQTITTSDGGAIVYNPDANATGSGNVLKYDFVAQSNSLTYTFAVNNGNAASFHQYAFNNVMPGYGAILTDNFYAPSNPNTLDMNFNLAARQGGYLAGTPYSTVGNQQVGNPTGLVDNGNYLLSASGGLTSPNQNFNGGLSVQGQLISFDVSPDINGGGSGNWTAINLGMSQADRFSGVNGAASHFGILFRGDGRLEAWDGSTNLTPVNPDWKAGGDITNGLHHIELLLSDPTDGNPFDGVGQTDIKVYAEGLLVYTFSKLGGGYSNNYINFQGASIGGIDNLLIARVPEPASITLLGMGLIGLFGLRRRQRQA